MGTTKALTSAEDVWCTSFFGGPEKGICFDMTIVRDGVRAKATFTKDELFQLIAGHHDSNVVLDEGLPRPEMDRF